MIDEFDNKIFFEPKKSDPTLVYVAGLAYSGTTLFATALGHSEKFINGGEVNFVENDYDSGKNCSCGVTIDECELWKPLIERLSKEAASGEQVLHFSPDQYLRPIDSRSKPFWKQALSLAGVPADKLFGRAEVRDYVSRHSNFLRALADETNTNFVVDASKSFIRLDALNKYSDLPIHVIFLKRSIIQSYASRLKRAKRRNKLYTPIFAPFYLAIILARIIAIRRQLKRIDTDKITVVDYETFVQDTGSVEARLSEALSTSVDFGIRDKVVPIGHLHVFTGNIWLSEALQKGQTVELKLGDGKSSLTWFERVIFRAFHPLAIYLERKKYQGLESQNLPP